MRLHIPGYYINEGVRLSDDGHYIFDKDFDFDSDILKLTTDTSGMKTAEDLTYYYGYEFNNNVGNDVRSKFRSSLKHKMKDSHVFYNEDVMRFIENGIYRMDNMKRLNDFSLIISTANEYAESTLTGAMCVTIWDEVEPEVETFDQYSLNLFKKHCSEVTFDENRARAALLQTRKYGRSERELNNAIKSLKKQFEDAKAEDKLFTMKIYKPVIGRAGFIDFLKFKDERDQNVYRNLRAGKEVLICDDFLTSGSTVREIIRFLNTINPNVKISVFVLINQLRAY